MPPAGAGSPWATTLWSTPPRLATIASVDSRPRRTVARKTTSPRALITGASTPASTPDGMPGIGMPLVAIARSRPADHAKMPSTARPPVTAAAKATVPASLSAGVGCLPKPESRPTPATRSPSRATVTRRPARWRKIPSSEPPRLTVAKKATSPRALTGATMGSVSWPKRSKVPPPGAASPVRARARRVYASPAWAAPPGARAVSSRHPQSQATPDERASIRREYKKIGRTPQ